MVESTETIINQLKDLFKFLKDDPRILGILLYGSYARGEQTEFSDVDVCIVAPNQDKYYLFQIITHNLSWDFKLLDLRFFEELPLLIRGDIVEHGIIIYTPNVGDLTEYFFFSTRKDLEDYRFMIQHSI